MSDAPFVPEEELTTAPADEIETRYRARVIERYNSLGFAGLGVDATPLPGLGVDVTPLSDVALDDVFVRLTLTVEKRKPIPAAQALRERVVVTQEPISLSDALTKHLLIVGEPGAGKSTLLRWLAVTFAGGKQREADRLGPQADADRLPLLVELGQLPKEHLQKDSDAPFWPELMPVEVIRQGKTGTQDEWRDIPPTFLAQTLAEGRCLLLCDGLDEIADLSARRRMAKSLAEYARSSANRLVISSRPAGVSGSEATFDDRFRRLTIQRFTPQEVQRFFTFIYRQDRRLSADEQTKKADALYAAVKAAPKTLELATTPLLATLLFLIWREKEDLPERRVDLYERCCRMLIESWEAHHDVAYTGVLREIGWERHLRLLAPLAYAIHSREQRTDADHNELIPVLAKAIQEEGLPTTGSAEHEAERFLRTLGLRSGLLQFLGGDRYGFPHLTFQEYLAARYIAAHQDPSFSNKNYDPDKPNYIDLVMEHLHESWWRDVHMLVIGHLGSGSEGADKASKLLLRILHLYRPAWRLLRPSCVKWWNLPAQMGQLLSRQISWQWERRIAWVLAREFIFAAVGFNDCAPLGTDATLRQSLTKSADALIMQIIRNPSRVEDGVDTPLAVATSTLEKIGQVLSQVVSALLAALAYSDSDMRQAAAQSLGQMGQVSPHVVSNTLAALADSDQELVRYAAAQSLGKMGQASPQVMSALLAALADSDQEVRYGAALSLGELGQASPQVVSALLAALADSYEWVRHAAALSLGELGQASPQVVSALMAALADSELWVRYGAALSLGELGQASPQVVSALMAALADSAWSVRVMAAGSLGQLGQPLPQAASVLLSELAASAWWVRPRAALHLGELGQASPQVVSALMAALADSANVPLWRGPMWIHATRSLGKLGQSSPQVVSTLLASLADSDSNVREAAAGSLGELEEASPQVVSALVAMLADSDWQVRRTAAQSLGRLGQASPQVVSALLGALADSTSGLRRGAVQILTLGRLGQLQGQMRQPSSHVTFEELILSLMLAGEVYSSSNVRQDAAQILGQLKITDEAQLRKVLIALNRRLHDRDDDVRSAALTAIRQLLDGRPIPGYRWVPIRERRERFRRRQNVGYWVIGITVVLLLAWVAAGVATYLRVDPFIERFVAYVLALAALAAGGVQILSYFRRPPWDR